VSGAEPLTAPPWTGVALCADDFGVDEAVNDAIVELAQARRLSATSVLVDASRAQSGAAALKALPMDIGLHLNFTEAVGELAASEVMPLKQLIVKAHSGLLDRRWVQQGVDRQLDRFEEIFDRAPDYLDGHLHIHQLPVIRDVLLKALRVRYPDAVIWIRDTRALPGIERSGPRVDRFKTWVVGHLGMARLAREATTLGFGLNRGFAGVYDFTGNNPPFMAMMGAWLARCGPGALIMTHPSHTELPGDPIGRARVQEYEALASDDFAQLLEHHSLSVVRLSQMGWSLP
jgi:predicted glycoside hydrolase/deacetylase ChbG (UPF0249 family)